MRHDVIVVGSGPSGAMASQTLVEAGADTAMLDVGFCGVQEDAIPDKDFLSLRKRDPQQHRYFLGEEFEGISWDRIKTGPHLTPPRGFVTKGVSALITLVSDTFVPMESLAYGGLGSAWGLGSFVFSDAELKEAGLDSASMAEDYQIIADRIGVTGARDDAGEYTVGSLKNILPPVQLEKSFEKLFCAYVRCRNALKSRGIFMGRTPLALLTADRPGRRQTRYDDMDFWANKGGSAWRPDITLGQLKKKPNFAYHGGCFVTKFCEQNDGVEITVRRVDTNQEQLFFCRRLILAAGTLGTGRIVLRSLGRGGETLPILCNNYSYLACIQPRMIGRQPDERMISYSQLSLFYDPFGENRDAAVATLYGYRSLLLFRIAKELPLGFADGIRLLAALYPALVIAGIHHPEQGSRDKYIQLVKHDASPTGDALHARYSRSDQEIADDRGREQAIKKALRRLGCFPVRRIHPGFGGSIHYAGTLPFSREEKRLSLSPEGRLRGTRGVYVADGSGFRYLPAKGPTLTLMANAHRVARRVLEHG